MKDLRWGSKGILACIGTTSRLKWAPKWWLSQVHWPVSFAGRRSVQPRESFCQRSITTSRYESRKQHRINTLWQTPHQIPLKLMFYFNVSFVTDAQSIRKATYGAPLFQNGITRCSHSVQKYSGFFSKRTTVALYGWFLLAINNSSWATSHFLCRLKHIPWAPALSARDPLQ